MVILGIETTCDETAAAVVERTEDGKRPDSVQHRAVAGQRARRIRRRGAGDRRARPCRGARCHHRQGDGRGGDVVRSARRHRRRRRARPDRRRHRRPDHGEGHRARPRQAADRGQSSGGACAHRAAHRRDAVSLLPVSRLRRPYPNPRRARRRRLSALRRHGRRRDRRGLRQDREVARPRLSGRPAGREGSRARRSPSASRCRGRCSGATMPIFRCPA